MPDNPNSHDTEDIDDGITGRWSAFSVTDLVWPDSKKPAEAKPESELLRRIQRGGI